MGGKSKDVLDNKMNWSIILMLILSSASASPLVSSWFSLPFSWFYNSNSIQDVKDRKLSDKIVPGRYLLKHNQYDGLDAVLEAYNLDDDGIAAVREAKIITNIDVNDDGEVIIATFDAESEDNPNVVKFTPEIKTNITNPLNGETVSFEGSVLGPTMLRTKSRGLETNILEIKTWIFTPGGISAITEIVIEEEKLKIFAKQYMERVDDENNAKPLILKWV